MPSPAIIDNISELSAIMKTRYGPGVENQQNLAAMMWKRFGDAGVEFGGNSYEFPARMVNTQSVGARGYRQGLPQPILNVDVTARVRHKFNYASFDIPGPDIEKGKGNINAFVNTLTDKMKSLTESAMKDLNFQTYGDGTGVRATAVTSATTGKFTVNRIKYLRLTGHVNIISSTDGTTRRGNNGDNDPGSSDGTRYSVVAIDAATPAITVGTTAAPGGVSPSGGGGSVTAGDFVVRHNTLGSELTGLGAIVDDGVVNPGALVLQDIDRALNPLWKAKVFGNSGVARDLTLNLMQLAMDLPEVLSGRRIDLVVGSFNARDRYLQLLVPQKRFTDLKLDGGFQALEYNGRDFLVDVDCQDDTVYFLNKDSIKKFGLFAMQFVEQGGGILKHDNLAAGDLLYGFMRTVCNLGTVQANANAKIVDLTVDPAYVVSA